MMRAVVALGMYIGIGGASHAKMRVYRWRSPGGAVGPPSAGADSAICSACPFREAL